MRTLTICFILTLSSVTLFAQNSFQEGTHYEVVSDQRTATPTVTEFFSLYCGHCFNFEALVDTLKASLIDGAKFEKSHVNYLPRNNPETQMGIVKAFIAMQDLGMQKELSAQFFAAIHMKGIQIDSVDDIKQIFLANDVSEEKFQKLFSDPDLIKRATAMSKEWEKKKVDNVPTLLVNGMYKIDVVRLSSLSQLVSLTNYLLKK
ncbi:MAG: thiol:disulfide interchange protein DsbA [Parvicella sp.]|jgi:thiol:disulfide interchange protein DsbA